jgi:hypothetical protein
MEEERLKKKHEGLERGTVISCRPIRLSPGILKRKSRNSGCGSRYNEQQAICKTLPRAVHAVNRTGTLR